MSSNTGDCINNPSNSSCCPVGFVHQDSFVKHADCQQPINFYAGVMGVCIVEWITGFLYVQQRYHALRGQLRELIMLAVTTSLAMTTVSIAAFIEGGFHNSALVLWIVFLAVGIVFMNTLIKMLLFPLFSIFSRRENVETGMFFLIIVTGASFMSTIVTMIVGLNMDNQLQGTKVFNDAGVAYFMVNLIMGAVLFLTIIYWSFRLTKEVQLSSGMDTGMKTKLLDRLATMRKAFGASIGAMLGPMPWIITYFVLGYAPYYYVFVGLFLPSVVGLTYMIAISLIPNNNNISTGTGNGETGTVGAGKEDQGAVAVISDGSPVGSREVSKKRTNKRKNDVSSD
jgi:hypothetical protein